MARPKKPLDAQSGNTTSEYRNARKAVEEKCDPTERDELDTIPDDLEGEDAIKLWKTWTTYLKDIGFYGNVTVSDLIEYCNADAMIMKTWRAIKRTPMTHIKEIDAYANQIKKWSEEKTRCANRGGFSVTARINYAEMKTNNEELQIEDRFGI